MSCSIMFAHFKYKIMKIMQLPAKLRGLHSWDRERALSSRCGSSCYYGLKNVLHTLAVIIEAS